MSIFLTGTESFIGRALRDTCRVLGIEVVGVDNLAASGDASAVRADIRDPAIADLIPEGAIVVHLAAVSRDKDCRDDPRTAFDVNVNGTLNIAAAAARRSAGQLLFASTEWVYGDVRNDGIQLETAPVDVTSMSSEYALSKIAAEQLLKLRPASPPITVLRFGIVYGPRRSNWSAVEALFSAARTREEVSVGSLATARRFIHVQDVVTGILASRGRSEFEIFNISGDRPVSLREILEVSATMWNRTVGIVETNPAQPSIRNPDNAKARAVLGWKPAYDLKAGLADLKNYFETTITE